MSGTITFFRPEQPSNALFPMLVTELGMLTEVRPEQSQYLQLVVCQCILVRMVEK